MTSKKCKNCNTLKTKDNFYAHKTTADKLDQICKDCKKQKAYEWSVKNKAKRKEVCARYVKNNPEKRAKTNSKYYHSNKELVRERINEHKKKNPEMYAEWGRKHSNIRRARKLNNGQEAYTESQVLSTYGTNCHICDTPIKLKAPRKVGVKGWELGLHIDHVVPLSKGGPDSLQNVKPSHGKCNLEKNSMA